MQLTFIKYKIFEKLVILTTYFNWQVLEECPLLAETINIKYAGKQMKQFSPHI